MKKAMYILMALLLSVTAYAQTEERNTEFEDYSMQQVNVISQASKAKDYNLLITLLSDWEKQYIKLPQQQQDTYRGMANGVIYYNLACAYSMIKKKDKAIDYFKQSLALGYNNTAHIEEDTDLDNIRKDKRFIKLLAGIPKKDSYTEILQKTGKYLPSDTAGLPHFNYESVTNGRIQSVRKYFNLDSIAGDGDELSKIINLMTWVHNTIEHDGNRYTQYSEFDAIDLYNYYKATGWGVNCRMLAIVLNECYLSMGFKSRFVTCMPQDKNDQECHVINCVWSETLHKWIWMDPTNNAYWKDENGVLLSIEEVRERVIDNRPLILNEDANWNNQAKRTKKKYLDDYMAKNLYWFKCPANSYFNVESPYRNSNTTYISLIPEGFEEFTKGNANNEVTHDSDYFWQAPNK